MLTFKMADKMADKMAEKITRIRKERSFPEIPGVPNRSELMKPLIFPNSQRAFKIFTYLATLGAGLYCVFIPEYEGDHCFVPIREWVQKQKGKFLKIRPEDEEYVKQRTAEMAEKVAIAAKQTSGEAGGNIGKS
ncbi:uncharacterized protein [Pocillopora verrucosa]|uniref:uncharacterized protein n=1 Tax=Pocillopora verrucosa TaxID=203993 RepID=UPI003340B4DD